MKKIIKFPSDLVSSLSLHNTRKLQSKMYSTGNYARLVHFNPEPEILKFYRRYLNLDTHSSHTVDFNFQNLGIEEYNQMLKEKINKVNSLSNKGTNIFDRNLSKLTGFYEFKSQTKQIIKIINEKIASSEHSDLQELSEYNFKQAGKMIRPYLLILLSKYIYECKDNGRGVNYFESDVHRNYILPFAAGVETIHNSSLLHDDIIDNSDIRRNNPTAHKIWGVRNTVFGASYLISRAADLITELNISHLNEIFSTMVFNLVDGEIQQSLRSKSNLDEVDDYFQNYMLKTYYKTGSLLALGLRGVGVIHNLDEEMQRSLFNLGLHIGITFQLVDDVLDVEVTGEVQKPIYKDLVEGVINSHILFEICDDKSGTVLEMAKRKFKGDGDLSKVISILNNGRGVIKTKNLALDHTLECYKMMNDSHETETKQLVYQCFQYLINRKY